MIKSLLEVAEQKPTSPSRMPKFAVLLILLVAVVAIGFWRYQERIQSVQKVEAQKAVRSALIAEADEVVKLEQAMNVAPSDYHNDAFIAYRDAVRQYEKKCAAYDGPWPSDEPQPSRPCGIQPNR